MKIKNYYRILILVFTALVLIAAEDNAKADRLNELKSAFSLKNTEHFSPFELDPLYVAFDFGEQALPFLEGILTDPNEERSFLALHSIAYIGGTKAVGILRKLYNSKADTGIKTLLCFALSSTGTKKDIKDLISSLR